MATLDPSTLNWTPDLAINGIPFLRGQSSDNPMIRQTAESRTQQIDTSKEPGEQSLQDWWLRSQSSFDRGAGIDYLNISDDELFKFRYRDSENVDTITTPGATVLQNATQLFKSTSGQNLKVIGLSNDSTPFLYSDGALLYAANATYSGAGGYGAITTTSIAYNSRDTAATILDWDTDGSRYFVVNATGVYSGATPNGGGTIIFNWSSITTNSPGTVTRATIKWVKDRLIVVANNFIYQVAVASGATPTLIQKMQNTNWTCTSIFNLPKSIGFAGYISGKQGGFWTATLTNNAAGDSTVGPLAAAGELPFTEVPLSAAAYMGVYLIIGTNRGFRIGNIQTDSGGDSLKIGPATTTAQSVYAVAAKGDFAYTGGMVGAWSDSTTGINNVGKPGLYKVALSRTSDSTESTFPYQKDAIAPISTSGTYVVSSVSFGSTADDVIFAVKGVGIYYQRRELRVIAGMLETSRIRYDTTEQKIFQYLKSANDLTNYSSGSGNTPPNIAIQYNTDTNPTFKALTNYDTNTSSSLRIDASDAEPHIWLAYRFVLTPGTRVTQPTGSTITPVFRGYTLQAQPSLVKQWNIQEVLLMSQVEEDVYGKEVIRGTYDRRTAIETFERKHAVVTYQDFGTGETRYVQIDSTRFVSPEVGSGPSRVEPNGLLIVTLKTVDAPFARAVS